MRIVSSSWLADGGDHQTVFTRPIALMSRTREQKKKATLLRPFSGPEKLDRTGIILA
jgi:hypothetical protein